MAQKIKVQDGIIAYSASDPTEVLDLTVAGTVTVTNEITVGSVNSPIDGVISTGDGTTLDRAQLDITTGDYGDLIIKQSPTGGKLFLNNAQWPTGAEMPQPGMYLGASNLNTLEYLSFALGPADDSWTVSMLNSTYPTASAGQFVVGTTVLYMCISEGQWRTLGAAGSGSISAPLNQLVYGTGPSTTSSPGLTFNSTSGTLTVGSPGTASITANTGEALAVLSDVSITLDAPGIIATGFVQFGSFITAPASPANGMVYYDSTLNKFRGYENGSWVNLI